MNNTRTPGDILLKDYLEPKGISQNYIARAIGVSPRAINQIVLGKRAITPKMSIRLGAFFGQPDDFWHSRQTEYEFASLNEEKERLVSSITPFLIPVDSGIDRRLLREPMSMPLSESREEKGSRYSDIGSSSVQRYGSHHNTESDFNPVGARERAEIEAFREGCSWDEAKAAGESAVANEYKRFKNGFYIKWEVASPEASAAAWKAIASAVKKAKKEAETGYESCVAEAEVWEKYGYPEKAEECRQNASKLYDWKPQNPIEDMGQGAYVATLQQGKTRAEAEAAKWKVEATEYAKMGNSEQSARMRKFYIDCKSEVVKQKKYITELKRGKRKKESLILAWRAKATEYEKEGEHVDANYWRARADKSEKYEFGVQPTEWW
ncbi:MAG: HigA family addiction module antitoxin [Candidatus Dadabacteria bacterium]|nr:HigA family addiction module antitoxin [Candidatus Dadabacteria bacterium]